ncbi:MAG TPA: sulfite exporter TauE/SafE family protein, partial [Nitrospira sp.]|nr:sulfite exporter TauE/SafE family protein [Nitrospira sp.]
VARALRLASSYPDREMGRNVAYGVKGVPAGFGMMYVAGLVSGLLGIGSGTLKVLAMDTAMGLPIKVSSATSNFMIGVTAAASAGIYFWRGDVVPVVAGPVALGILVGATLGARMLLDFRSETIRILFLAVLALVSTEMLLRGAGIA